MDSIAWKLLAIALGIIGVIVGALSGVVWWSHTRNASKIDDHDKEFTLVRREVGTEFSQIRRDMGHEFTGRDTITRLESTWEDKLESLKQEQIRRDVDTRREIEMRHTANEDRFNRIDDKLDTIINKLMERNA